MDENGTFIAFTAGSEMDEEMLRIIDRITKLSQRPDNPGMAYRNLETINALVYSLNQKLRNKPCPES